MSENFPSQKYLEGQLKNLAERLEKELAHVKDDDGTNQASLNIQDDELSADIGKPSPVAEFIKNTRKACDEIITPPRSDIRSSVTAKAAPDRNAEFIAELDKQVAAVTGTRSQKKELEIAKKLQKDKRFSDLPIANDLVHFTRLKNLDEAIQLVMNQRTFHSTAQEFVTRLGNITGLGTVSGNKATEAEWNELHNEMVEQIKNGVCGCSLIYSYWLDEGGLQIAIERVADRVENGIVSTTEALKMLHINESSDIVDIVSSFIVSWQRGELFDVDARRKQYQAQYGFPLHAARAWGNISTGDPRAVFAGAFHRFLYEASRYYDAQRDLLKTPIVENARSAIGQLLDALREGNENMRKKRTAQIRGQTEYTKRLLGGSVKGNPLAIEWSKYLTGRPGITDADDTKIWHVKSDAVASLYGWNRPRIKDYETLAESGETILVATRIGGEAASGNEGMAKAFVELLRPYVLDYVNAFKVVGGVDLGRKLVTAPPAIIMARKVRAPAIPPLKRHWAAITPAALRSSAA